MRIFKLIVLGLLILLSISTALVKLMYMETEMELFRNAGFSDPATVVFGLIQLAGGLLLLFPRFRRIGAIVMAITFSIATVVLFINGQTAFGFFSLLFIAMAAWFIKTEAPNLKSIKE